MRVRDKIVLVGLALLLTAPLSAQKRRDPLTDAEVDLLREQAQDGDERLKLWVKFVRARSTSLDQARASTRTSERLQKTHALLEDLASMVDEMDDNVDTYAKQKSDIRKSLKSVIEVDTELQAKLKALKEGTDPNAAKDLADYSFVLDNAIESVDQSLDGARQTLVEQEEYFKALKEQEKNKNKKKEAGKSGG